MNVESDISKYSYSSIQKICLENFTPVCAILLVSADMDI